MIKFRFRRALSHIIVAAVLYVCFAVYLYRPYIKYFSSLQYLLILNSGLASLGCYVLSQQWVPSFWCSFFAGAIYGFGPFMLGLVNFHPTAGFLAASIPWLFYPTVFLRKSRFLWLQFPLSALPFLAVVLFFQVAAYYRLFAIPIQAKLHLGDVIGIFTPFVMKGEKLTRIGFYHVAIPFLIVGFLMLIAGRRFGVIIIICAGVILSFCNSILGISPIIWLSLPVLCCSVLVGAGMQGLVSAGHADRKWVFIVAVVTVLLGMLVSLTIRQTAVFVETAKMYALASIMVVAIFLMLCIKLRLGWLRLIIVCFAMGIDLFIGAQFIIDRVF